MRIWRISAREAQTVRCPKCKAEAPQPCNRMSYSSYNPTGTIKRPHDERFHAAARSKLDGRRATFLQSVRGIQTEFDRREDEALRAWLKDNWEIFVPESG